MSQMEKTVFHNQLQEERFADKLFLFNLFN